jgi:hypothetical protein
MHYITRYIAQWRTSMRKMLILLIIALFFTAAGSALADVAFKGSYDFNGIAKYESFQTDAASGFDVSVEYYGSVLKVVQLGGGIEYQFPRANEDSGEFSFVPIYGAVRVIIPVPAVKPYVIGRIGYNLFRGDAAFVDDGSGGQASLKGGLTYGVGAGIIFLKFVLVEGQYAVNKGTLKYGTAPGDVGFTYSRFQLSAGINLAF